MEAPSDRTVTMGLRCEYKAINNRWCNLIEGKYNVFKSQMQAF